MRANGFVFRDDEELAELHGRRLNDFLRAWARKPFVWGVCDCCLFMADWIEWRDGVDPAARFRGTYSTEREMRRLLQARGGIVNHVADCAASVGLKATNKPEPGDVALVKVAIKFWRGRAVLVPIGAVMVRDQMWAVKARESSLSIQPFPVMIAWGRHG